MEIIFESFRLVSTPTGSGFVSLRLFLSTSSELLLILTGARVETVNILTNSVQLQGKQISEWIHNRQERKREREKESIEKNVRVCVYINTYKRKID